MDYSLLTAVVDLHDTVLSELAAAWIDAGAQALYLTDHAGAIIGQWPSRHMAVCSAASVAIQLNGECIGHLHLCGEMTSALLARLASDARWLSEIVRMEYDLEKMTADLIDQQDQLMALHQLAQTTRVDNDIQQNLTDLARIASQLLKTEDAFMVLQTDREAPLPVMYPLRAWWKELWPVLLNEMERTPEKKQWLLHQHDPFLTKLGLPIRNLLVKKLVVRPGIWLILGVANKIGGDFHAPDLKLFSTIAEPAGANLENAILHREILDQTRIQTEMELAKQVQMRLLPQHTPQLLGIELAAQSCPAFQVGGDSYDFIVSQGDLLTFTLSDVSGKGMPAALLMTMLRTVLRGKAVEMTTAAPEELLRITNESLYDDFSEVNMFATVFIGQYDYARHLLYYANDGHAPVIYRSVAGPAVLLPADAPPLGVLPINLAERQVLAFQPGDLLVITSDGFNEAERKDEEMFGYERLLQLVDQFATLPATELMKNMFAAIQDFSGGHPQSDDQTLLILRRMQFNESSS
ncbi:MAG: PP2C family protein-serine/threonine phosphatase [Chloroflexi bacterium]|nr:PP2C family protein-serine/threonine phosphatase [Chloroflexota bacterium]